MKDIKGKTYLLLAFSLAGTSVVTGRFLSGKLGSFTITAVSLGLLLICLSPFYAARTMETIRRLKATDWKMLMLQALFGIFLFRAFLLSGVNLTSAAEAGMLTGAAPAVTSLLAFFFLKESLSKKTVLGIGCTVIGIVLLQGINLDGAAFSIRHFWGNALVLCAAASESVFNVISRKQGASSQSRQQIHPMVQTLLVSAFSFVLCLVPAFLESPVASIKKAGLMEWSALAWYGLIVTALAFVSFYAGVKRCDAYTTAAFSGMMPLTSLLLSVLLLNEGISLDQLAGGFLIISGMLLIRGKPAVEERRKAHPVNN